MSVYDLPKNREYDKILFATECEIMHLAKSGSLFILS